MTENRGWNRLVNKLGLIRQSWAWSKQQVHEPINLRSKMVKVADCQEQLLGNVNNAQLQTLYQGGWQVLINSASNNLTQKYHYRAVAFINKRTSEVHIAHAGTLITNFCDLWDDVKLFLNQIPGKVEPLKFFVNQVIGRLGGVEAALDYTFSSSGHSLGAILSDLMAAELMSRGLLFYQSSTFENPGSYQVVKRAIQQNCLSGQVSLQTVQPRCYEYSAKRNFINALKPRLAEVVQLVTVEKGTQKIAELPGTLAFLKGIGLAKLVEVINQHQRSNFRNISKQNTFATTRWDNPDLALYNANWLSDAI